MIVELAKPVAVIICILALYSVFHVAFLNPVSNLDQRIEESLGLAALAGGISVASGLIFCDATQTCSGRLASTLPVKMFCWAASVMLILFLAACYLEKHCVLYRDIRPWV
jgi:hypothetical protein